MYVIYLIVGNVSFPNCSYAIDI